MRFQFPWAFLILLVLPAIVWLSNRTAQSGTLKFSSVENARRSGASWRMRLLHLPLALRLVSVVLLIVALARPQLGLEQARDVSEGIAIEMVVDRSGSMKQEFIYDGRQTNRLDVVKKLFKEFVLGNGRDLQGRPDDLIGMVAFARYADTVCPLTLSHGALEQFIDNIQVVRRKAEDGTAIGEGLALAAARLKTAEDLIEAQNRRGAGSGGRPSAERNDYKIKSKVIILLTDGQNNFGKRSPEEAARLAKEWGIKVYVVGIGGQDAFQTIQTPFGSYKVPGGPGVDEATLRTIAQETGGAYWMAESADKLRGIYQEIDKLERTRIESTHALDYSEKFGPFALAALALLILEQILLSSVFRRIP